MNELTSKLNLHASRRAGLLLSCLLAAACGSHSDGGGNGAADASGGASPASGGSAGSANANGGTASDAAGAGGMSSQAGTASTSGGTSSASGGSAGASLGPASVTVTSFPVSVSSGQVFNVADDFFNDGFVPPSPLANFGFHTPIIPLQSADGGLDVAWLDYSGGKSAPFELPAIGMINLTHIDAALTTGTTVATGIQSYRLLGFTVDPSGNFYIA
ncbi:MAG TPA: hypothetical protein VK745_10705, partial [Polyangiaceae bacterium]|nr:hypothetical protein [Polyangiaceae bacterium]